MDVFWHKERVNPTFGKVILERDFLREIRRATRHYGISTAKKGMRHAATQTKMGRREMVYLL